MPSFPSWLVRSLGAQENQLEENYSNCTPLHAPCLSFAEFLSQSKLEEGTAVPDRVGSHGYAETEPPPTLVMFPATVLEQQRLVA